MCLLGVPLSCFVLRCFVVLVDCLFVVVCVVLVCVVVLRVCVCLCVCVCLFGLCCVVLL